MRTRTSGNSGIDHLVELAFHLGLEINLDLIHLGELGGEDEVADQVLQQIAPTTPLAPVTSALLDAMSR